MALNPEQFASLKTRLGGNAPISTSTFGNAGPASSSPAMSSSQGGFLDRVGQDFRTRAAQADTANKADQNILSKGLQNLGAAAGFIGDVGGEALVSVDNTLTGGAVTDALGGVAQDVMAAPSVQNIMADYGKWKLGNPEAAANLEATVNIGSLIPIGAGAAVAAKTGVRAAEMGIDTAKTAGRAVANAPVVSTVVDVAKGVGATAEIVGGGIARIPGRIATNVAEKQAITATIKELPTKVAQSAAFDGVDIADIKTLYNLPEPQKAPVRQLAKVVREFADGNKSVEPERIVGRPIVDRIKQLEKVKSSVGPKIGKAADEIGALTTREIETPVFASLQKVPGLQGLKVSEGGKLDFTDTALQTAATASDRKVIQRIFTDAVKDGTGKQKHLLRQELFEVLDGKKKSLANITGTQEKAFQAIRKGLADVLETRSGTYKQLNTEYAKAAQPLTDLKKFLKNEGLDEDLLEMKAGTLARRLTSNAMSKSDIRAVLRAMDKATEVPGKSQISVEALQDAYNIFATYYPEIVGATSMRGVVRSGVEDVTGFADLAVKAVSDVAGKSDAVRRKAFEKALEEALK